MLKSGQTPWYKVVELNVATTSGMKVVCRFPVRVKGLQGKKRAEYMFRVGKGLHSSWSYRMYHEEDGWSVWYGLRGLQGVGGDEVPESVIKVFGAWVNERKESYIGGRGHTRGAVIEVEGDDDDAEDKEQPKDKDKDKGKDKAKDEPKEKGMDKGQRKGKDKDKDKDKNKTTRASQSPQSQSQQSEHAQQMVDARAMADEVVQRCKDFLTQHMSATLRDCVPSAMGKAMSDASKSMAETVIGQLTKQLETELMGWANAEAQLDNELKRVKELELENESMKKELVESNTKTAEAKQQVEQLLAMMAGNYKKA